MQISFPTNIEQLLKLILNVGDLTETIQKVAMDWANYTIDTKYKEKKTIDEKITELTDKIDKPIKIGGIKHKK